MSVKIGVIISNQALSGGGFNQALAATLQMARVCDGKHELIVYTSEAENIEVLKKLGLSAELLEVRWRDRFSILRYSGSITSSIARRLKLSTPFESRLTKDGVELAYFASLADWTLFLASIPYVTTVWDLCHRDSPEFPEVRAHGQFEFMDRVYRETLPKAYLILADSARLAERIERRYGVDRERILAMPFSPSPLSNMPDEKETMAVMDQYGLDSDYVFYPAQFWPHKNHYRLLDAVRRLAEKGIDKRLVFCGSDKGNLSYVKTAAEKMGISERVSFLGFVPHEHIGPLYKGAGCVCISSYFGPTNIPPLEAWLFEVPLLYGNIYTEQTGDAALYFDPDDTQSLAEAMMAVDDPDTRSDLIDKGRKRLRQLGTERSIAETLLAQHIETFEKRRQCWQ